MRLLLIEDDTALCAALAPALGDFGRPEVCHTGPEGLALLASGGYDLCILDRMLPGLDGVTLLRAARAKGVTTPVLLLTALAGPGEVVDGLDAGADDYLPKPFDTAVLQARLRALLRRSGGGAVLQAGDLRLDPAELTLTGPAGAAELSRKECALLEALRRGFLHTAQREADRLARLTGDLQLLAAGDAGALTVRPGPVAADTLCIEVYEQFYLLARAQGRRLTLQLPEAPLPPLVTDGGRLTQLLTILLQNALDHTPPGTPVELTLQPAPGRLRLRVIDHGPGIPDDRKEQVFDRFFRADASRTRKENFGLGLSVARELARGLGAALTLADTSGGGATFTVDLPA